MMAGLASIMVILEFLLAQEVVGMVWVVERVVAATMLSLMWANGVFGLLCMLSPLLDCRHFTIGAVCLKRRHQK